MKKFTSVVLGVISTISLAYTAPQAKVPIVYQEPTTGVEIVFTADGTNWEKIKANGESELLFGNRKDVRNATSKAILRAKASITKFLQEKLSSTETMEEITKTISSSTRDGKVASVTAKQKTVETMIESIIVSSEAILKGVLVLEQVVNQKDKYVRVQVGISRKTMRIADSISNDMNRDMSQPNGAKGAGEQQYNDGKNEIRRSKNYNNF